MCNSIKIYGKNLDYQSISIQYKQLQLPYKLIKKFKIDEKKNLNIKTFPTFNTILNDYFTKIDIYVYKTKKIVFSFNNLKIDSENIDLDEIFDELLTFINEYFIKETEILNNYNIDLYLRFCYKFNLSKLGCTILKYNDCPLYKYLFKKTAKFDFLKIKNQKNFLIFFDQIIENPLILEPIINLNNLNYLEKIYYFTKMAFKYEEIGLIKQSCTNFVHLYFCLIDGKHLYLKNYIKKKVLDNCIWKEVFENIFQRIKNNENKEIQMFLRNCEIPILQNVMCLEGEFDFRINFNSIEKIDFFEKSEVYFRCEDKVYFQNTITCTLISKNAFKLISIVVEKPKNSHTNINFDKQNIIEEYNFDEEINFTQENVVDQEISNETEIFIDKEIKIGTNKFNFNLKNDCLITKLKIFNRNVIKSISIPKTYFKKIHFNFKYKGIKIIENNDFLEIKFKVENKPKLFVLKETFEIKYEVEFVNLTVKKINVIEILAQVCEDGFRRYKIEKRDDEWVAVFN